MKSYVKDYPRPQFFRSGYELLDGVWDFAFDDNNVGEKKKWHKGFEKQHDILVPFTYETKLSGIGDETEHNYIWYQKTIVIDENYQDMLLHFEGSDYTTKVWVNGDFVGMHNGGYSRFSFDITNSLQPNENIIVVKVEDFFVLLF